MDSPGLQRKFRRTACRGNQTGTDNGQGHEADTLKHALESSGKVSIQVNFATDAAAILPDSEPQILQVTQLLKADERLRLSVAGHTDDSGSPSHNPTLSQARAESVRNRLVSRNRSRSTGSQGLRPRPTACGEFNRGRTSLESPRGTGQALRKR
ncbi:OmpA family protein [Stenotrophomonas sp.]|uniref:OmpA family protein n=1 Tax=Stenotrophomonas sp. TaxID=69392 RepID=UPI00289D30D1|nr:OmpA family protein [Stenotrophomonas sp.]